MSADEAAPRAARTLIVGGGIAGLEALLALHDLAEDRAELTLVAPDPDFTYKPLVVEEPFSMKPAERHELGPLLSEFGGQFVQRGVTGVLADDHAVELDDGSRMQYEILLVCTGGRARDPYKEAVTFRVGGAELEIDALLTRAAEDESRTLAFVVPPGVTWPLPIYELALMSRRRAEETDLGDVRLTVITPEAAPLIMFGHTASDAVAELLRIRKVDVQTETYVSESAEGEFSLAPGSGTLDASAIIALVDAIPPVRGKRGRPRQRPAKLLADRAYWSHRHHRELRQRKITPQVAAPKSPHGSGLGKQRWVVERTISWLHQKRRLRLRYERRGGIHEALLSIGCCLICFKRLQAAGSFC